MKIDQGQISFLSTHSREAYVETQETIHLFERDQKGERTTEYQRQSRSDEVSLGVQVITGKQDQLLPELLGRHHRGLGKGLVIAPAHGQDKPAEKSDKIEKQAEISHDSDMPESVEELKLAVFVRLMEQIFGSKFDLIDKREMQRIDKDANELKEIANKMEQHLHSQKGNAKAGSSEPEYGWRMDYQASTVYREEEYTRFAAQGRVTTGDGREINLQLELGLSRAFESTEVVQAVAGTLKDPLVINFDAPSVGLKDQETFRFDIDADGQIDSLAQLKAGSGFLALDRNGDGQINDGTELFGAQSGNGFADLAALDDDQDGFIDEDDAVFSQLRIWIPNDQGEAQLYALLDKEVGAIYLGHADTKFALNREADNENLGMLRSSGVFIKESGEVGTIQQIDLQV
ncbi:hypothetical protein [Oceanospirillum multiglobuliferum]|uniref:Uncharacterized protein n=1 Tax=Oceanospirillum multiglobuliferum TaxID=64969 RepID=A0A1V4T3X0_9GAMM|nr:hypothetical protein [Oceanospirillum multiglobuliferum]OPX54868.1 hypothetical protein BTE48_12190 [Oceanospirillum multiglobuliferum]